MGSPACVAPSPDAADAAPEPPRRRSEKVLGSVGYLSEYRLRGVRFLCPFPSCGGGGQLMATGTVKWFSAQRGCGFIVPDDGGTPLFVDHREIVGPDQKTLTVDTKVRFEPQEGEYGLEAKNVTRSTA